MHHVEFDQRTRSTNWSIAVNLRFAAVCLYLIKQMMNIILRYDEINETLNSQQVMDSNFHGVYAD